jgi:hypothetical protein
MWFVNFVLIVTVLITSLVLGWATYLERSASAPRVIEAVPLPIPKPKLTARRSPESEEAELVVTPKAKEVSHKKDVPHKRERKLSTW